MNDKLTQIMQEVARLAAETAEASSRGDMEAVVRLQLETETTWQRARRLGQQKVSRPTVSKSPSARDRVVSALTELNVPSSPKLIAAFSEARSGAPFDQRALASIRRDERRSWESGSRRDTYVLPTLEGPWFTAGRGRVVLSHWPLWQRIVGPLSPRVDHLKVCLRTVDQCEAKASDPEMADRMCKLLRDLARTVPDALVNSWTSSSMASEATEPE